MKYILVKYEHKHEGFVPSFIGKHDKHVTTFSDAKVFKDYSTAMERQNKLNRPKDSDMRICRLLPTTDAANRFIYEEWIPAVASNTSTLSDTIGAVLMLADGLLYIHPQVTTPLIKKFVLLTAQENSK